MKLLNQQYLPLAVYLANFAFVWGCLLFSPIQYKDMDVTSTFLYTGAVVLMFACGYLGGAKRFFQADTEYCFRVARYVQCQFCFRLFLAFGIIGAVVQWYGFAKSGGSLDLSRMGESYLEGYAGYERGQATVGFAYVANIINQVVTTLVLIYGLYYFDEIKSKERFGFLFILLTYLVINVIGTGKQKFVGDIAIYTFYCAMIQFVVKNRKLRLRTILLTILFAATILFFLVEILRQRYAAAGIGLDNFGVKSHPLISWNDESALVDLVGEDYAFAMGILSGYFTNGLYGLSLCLSMPFEWSYLVGNSYSVGRVLEILLGFDGAVLEHTYPYRAGQMYGWGFDKWHSLFSWLASDLSFFGVLLLALPFGFIYARLWYGALTVSTFFSGPLFIFLSHSLVFSFANNQAVHALSGVIVLVLLSGGQLVSRVSMSRRHRKDGFITVPADRRGPGYDI